MTTAARRVTTACCWICDGVAGQNLNLNANYTWSHCIGLPTITLLNPGANYIHQAYQNNGSTNRNLDIGNCNQDRRQIMNTTMVAKTPKFSGKTLNMLASGWSLSTIYQVRSGAPLTITSGTDLALNGFSSQRPSQINANAYGDRDALTGYFNTAAFAQTTAGTYGNLGIGTVVGPGFWEWDESISRQFQIREGQQLEFRAEAFNVTNSLRRGNPGVGLSNANTFGVIQSSVGGPRILQFALKYVF